MSAITTHVLDTTLGRPAQGVPVTLEDAGGVLAAGTTDAGGRVGDLGPERLAPGTYRLRFDTASYFSTTEQDAFFPEVSITFNLTDPQQHYHVPVLLSPFTFSTYRGS